MKIMHCADIHLDSKMESRLTPEQAAKRREEMLLTFHDSLDYAAEHEVKAVLIAGDLFDKRHIRKSVKDKVKQEIISHTDMDFYYLRGNHDITDFLDEMEEIPKNLHLFTKEKWSSYQIPDQNIVITGRELDAKSTTDVMSELVLDQSKVKCAADILTTWLSAICTATDGRGSTREESSAIRDALKGEVSTSVGKRDS